MRFNRPYPNIAASIAAAVPGSMASIAFAPKHFSHFPMIRSNWSKNDLVHFPPLARLQAFMTGIW
jgi:hypothetical protein